MPGTLSLVRTACLILVACSQPGVVEKPQAKPVVVNQPSLDAAPPSCDAPSPFTFEAGKPEERFHDYAIKHWGPDGGNVFTSQATSRQFDRLRLIDVGQYAVVQLAPGDFFYRDFGDDTWLGEMTVEAAPGPKAKAIVVTYSRRDRSVIHMIREVWSIDDERHPQVVFAHEELATASCCGSEAYAPPRVSNTIAISEADIRVRTRDVWRVSEKTWHETALPGIEPVLVPWSQPTERVYRWNGCKFEP